jgi:integrase
LGEYARRWIEQRPKLRPRTMQLDGWLLGKHIAPHLGGMPLSKLDTPMIREWRSLLLASGASETIAAKAYRLLRAVLNTAVREDEILRVNPCRVPGADREEAQERPVLAIGQVLELASLMPDRYRALVLVTTFACLRWGEVTALQRQDLDVESMTVRVRQQFTELRGVGLVLGPPKSRAGSRTVTVPAAVGPAIRQHLAAYVGQDPDALVFTGPSGRPIWRGNFNPLVGWSAAVAAIGAPGLHFHDLRHSGNTLASKTGTSLKDLMARMGHDSPRAALIYQHRTSEADQAIARAVNEQLEVEQRAAEAKRKEDRPA